MTLTANAVRRYLTPSSETTRVLAPDGASPSIACDLPLTRACIDDDISSDIRSMQHEDDDPEEEVERMLMRLHAREGRVKKPIRRCMQVRSAIR